MAITLKLDDKKRKAKPDRLTGFLFLLLRDWMTMGTIEDILAEIESGEPLYCPDCIKDGFLEYVAKVRERIVG